MSKWPDLFFTEGAPNGDLVGFGVGKIEGDPIPEKLDYRGHVSVLTIAPEYRRARFSLAFMKYIEDVSEKMYDPYSDLFCRDNAFFVDLFVRKDNDLAVAMYKKLQYSVYRHILEYYGNHNDAYGSPPSLQLILDMRKALPRDTKKASIVSPYSKPIHVSKTYTTLSPVCNKHHRYNPYYYIITFSCFDTPLPSQK